MTPLRWQKLRDLFHAAATLGPAERGEFLVAACAGDGELCRELEALLACHDATGAIAPDPATFRPFSLLTPFSGTQRFSVKRELGEGAFGIVYSVHDRDRNQEVALKLLRRTDPTALLRFKREFRVLADTSHANLARLYELFADNGQWFFTMELVDGVPFLRYVWGDRVPTSGRRLGGHELARLRSAASQLVNGTMALHASGVLHGDVKPANALVTEEGRVVLLDFGLVREIASEFADQSLLFAGTPAYMSPEQAEQHPAEEASDWYAVGVLLFECLTGRPPFQGPLLDVLRRKCQDPAPLASSLAPETPPELDALCRDLLERDPARRPSGAEILERIGDRGTLRPSPLPPRSDRSLFVGREKDLSALRAALDRAKQGLPSLVRVQGASGIGKTALVRHFLDELRESHGNALVLAGRCRERESVPFKALDEVVDQLSRYLRRMPDAEATAFLPGNWASLVHVFPVLGQVPALASTAREAMDGLDPQERRWRAMSGLRTVFTRVSVRQPLVVWIDDLQWGDRDSMLFLRTLLASPDAPALLLIVSHRSEDAPASPVLQLLGDIDREQALAMTEITLGGLPPERVRELTVAMLRGRTWKAGLDVEAILRESGGIPLFLGELVRYALTTGGHSPSGPSHVTLMQVIQDRIGRLPSPARRILQAVALAGHPLTQPVVLRVAEVQGGESGFVELLVRERFLRVCGSSGLSELDTYHDQVREAATRLVPLSECQGYHRRLAMALELAGEAHAERLVYHFQQTGEPKRAYEYAVKAAWHASELLAFDRAAHLYGLALHLRALAAPAADGHEEARELTRRLADATARAQHRAEAAALYRELATQAAPEERLELTWVASDQLLRGGRVMDGIALLKSVLRQAGVRIPATRLGLLIGIAQTRLRIRLQGLQFEERPAKGMPQESLVRLDVLWKAALALIAFDPLLAGYLQGQHLLRALRLGEPSRVAASLAVCEAVYRTLAGADRSARAQVILAHVSGVAKRLQDPSLEAFCALGGASVAALTGRWDEMEGLSRQAETLLRARCTDVAWELSVTRVIRLGSLALRGRWREIRSLLPSLLEEARLQGDLNAEKGLPLAFHTYLVHLAGDEPESAERALDDGIRHWPLDRFDGPHYSWLYGRVECALYRGESRQASGLLWRHWRALWWSFIPRVEVNRVLASALRARCALAVLSQLATDGGPEASGAARARLQRDVRRCLPRLERVRVPYAQGIACLLRASLAASRWNVQAAMALLVTARNEFLEAGTGMRHYAAACDSRRGELLGGAAGMELQAGAEAVLRELGALNPQAMVRMLAPGDWRRP